MLNSTIDNPEDFWIVYDSTQFTLSDTLRLVYMTIKVSVITVGILHFASFEGFVKNV
jgi:hypothetical protein